MVVPLARANTCAIAQPRGLAYVGSPAATWNLILSLSLLRKRLKIILFFSDSTDLGRERLCIPEWRFVNV